MKKLILTISALTAFAFANAQSIVIYDGTATQKVNSGSGFYNFGGCTNTTDYANAQPTTGTGATAGNNGTYLKLTGNTTGYYVCGSGNAFYDGGGNEATFGFTGTDLAANSLSFRVTTNNTTTKLKIQFTTVGLSPNKSFGYEFDFGTDADVKAGWTTKSILLNELKELVSNDPTGPAPTAAECQAFSKIELVLICTDLSGACYGELNLDDITIGATTSSKSAASKIASSSVYPNPVSDMATVAMELNAVSDVKVTLSDMMGKEMMTITEGNMSSVNANINVANLNKGIYSVNYTINGAAAKSELLMVK